MKRLSVVLVIVGVVLVGLLLTQFLVAQTQEPNADTLAVGVMMTARKPLAVQLVEVPHLQTARFIFVTKAKELVVDTQLGTLTTGVNTQTEIQRASIWEDIGDTDGDTVGLPAYWVTLRTRTNFESQVSPLVRMLAEANNAGKRNRGFTEAGGGWFLNPNKIYEVWIEFDQPLADNHSDRTFRVTLNLVNYDERNSNFIITTANCGL